MKIKKIWNSVVLALIGKPVEACREVESDRIEETFGPCCTGEGHGSLVTELPTGDTRKDLDYYQNKVAEKLEIDPDFLKEGFKSFLQSLEVKETERREKEETAKKEAEEAELHAKEAATRAEKGALELQKTIIQWQRLAGVTPEKTLDLLIPIKEGKNTTRRSVNFNNTAEMVAYLADKGFVPYDLEYIEEARTGKYRFIRIKKNEVINFFEFPDATFNGPEFYTPYKPDYSTPIVFGPYLAPHQLFNPMPMTVENIEAVDGKISILSPLSRNAEMWENKDGVFYPKFDIDYIQKVDEEEKFEKPKGRRARREHP